MRLFEMFQTLAVEPGREEEDLAPGLCRVWNCWDFVGSFQVGIPRVRVESGFGVLGDFDHERKNQFQMKHTDVKHC